MTGGMDKTSTCKIFVFLLRGSLLPSTSLLQCQVNDRTVAHVVISQGVGILNENALKDTQITWYYSICQDKNVKRKVKRLKED